MPASILLEAQDLEVQGADLLGDDADDVVRGAFRQAGFDLRIIITF